MKKPCAIVVPVYSNTFTEYEKISLAQLGKKLSTHPIILICPKAYNPAAVLEKYPFIQSSFAFENHYFSSIQGYNKLMLASEFYKSFLDYEYILIHQLDAFVFKDQLLYWCNKGYDYIGAPWLRYVKYPDFIKQIKNRLIQFYHIKNNIRQKNSHLPTNIQFENMVGNGGFSLRKTETFYRLSKLKLTARTNYLKFDEHYFNEDVFWSIEINRCKKRLKIPSYKTAAHFAIENGTERAFEITKGQLPFGCHAWDRHVSFWRDTFRSYGYEI